MRRKITNPKRDRDVYSTSTSGCAEYGNSILYLDTNAFDWVRRKYREINEHGDKVGGKATLITNFWESKFINLVEHMAKNTAIKIEEASETVGYIDNPRYFVATVDRVELLHIGLKSVCYESEHPILQRSYERDIQPYIYDPSMNMREFKHLVRGLSNYKCSRGNAILVEIHQIPGCLK